MRNAGLIRSYRSLAILTAGLLAACGGGEQAALDGSEAGPTAAQEIALPKALCELLPRADAERIMGKPLVEQRNDEWACHYQDAAGTTGTGLMLNLNAFEVADQCRLTPRSEPMNGIGSSACIAVGQPTDLYTTVVFGSGGRTFEVTAPGQDRTSELATSVAKFVLTRSNQS